MIEVSYEKSTLPFEFGVFKLVGIDTSYDFFNFISLLTFAEECGGGGSVRSKNSAFRNILLS